jgi:hypothetical protein
VESEYRRWWRDQQIFNGFFGITTDTRGVYVSGSYYSRLVAVWATDHDNPDNHVFD